MAENIVISQNDLYAARVFFNCAIPLLKVVVESCPEIEKKFVGKNFVFQISAKYDGADGGKMATFYVVKDGKFETHVSEIHEKPDIELEFSDLKKFITFFSGKGMPLPKLKGVFSHLGIFINLLKALLKMAGLLQATEPPKTEFEQALLVKLFFYLLPNGISQLNKAGHPKIHEWALESPDRAYAFAVTGYDELNSYIRVKEGNSKAGRGEYPRCKPFLTLRFDNPIHALGILLGTGDMIDFMSKGFLTVEGAPEFAAIVGDFMFLVGDLAKANY
ncbi:MAG: hypothetical protein RR458_05895 [Clostridia bacterium]